MKTHSIICRLCLLLTVLGFAKTHAQSPLGGARGVAITYIYPLEWEPTSYDPDWIEFTVTNGSPETLHFYFEAELKLSNGAARTYKRGGRMEAGRVARLERIDTEGTQDLSRQPPIKAEFLSIKLTRLCVLFEKEMTESRYYSALQDGTPGWLKEAKFWDVRLFPKSRNLPPSNPTGVTVIQFSGPSPARSSPSTKEEDELAAFKRELTGEFDKALAKGSSQEQAIQRQAAEAEQRRQQFDLNKDGISDELTRQAREAKQELTERAQTRNELANTFNQAFTAPTPHRMPATASGAPGFRTPPPTFPPARTMSESYQQAAAANRWLADEYRAKGDFSKAAEAEREAQRMGRQVEALKSRPGTPTLNLTGEPPRPAPLSPSPTIIPKGGRGAGSAR